MQSLSDSPSSTLQDSLPAYAMICELPVLTEPVEQIGEGIIRAVSQGTGAWVLSLNLDVLAGMYLDPDYANLLKTADYATADGMPIVWASRWKGGPRIEGRSTGIALSHALLQAPSIERVALVGGANPGEIANRFRPNASRSYLIRDEQITFTEYSAMALVASLKEFRAQLVLLALGNPKQDYFASLIRRQLPGITIIGVGGALDALVGLRRTPPRFLQNIGLEWLFRLACEPRRLWRRYLLRYPYGILLLLRSLRSRSASHKASTKSATDNTHTLSV